MIYYVDPTSPLCHLDEVLLPWLLPLDATGPLALLYGCHQVHFHSYMDYRAVRVRVILRLIGLIVTQNGLPYHGYGEVLVFVFCV